MPLLAKLGLAAEAGEGGPPCAAPLDLVRADSQLVVPPPRRPAAILSASNDVMYKVLELVGEKDIQNLMATCRDMRRLADSEAVWRMRTRRRWGCSIQEKPTAMSWKELYSREEEGYYGPVFEVLRQQVSVCLLPATLRSLGVLQYLTPGDQFMSILEDCEPLRDRFLARQEIVRQKVEFVRLLWVFPLVLLPAWLFVLACETVDPCLFPYPYAPDSSSLLGSARAMMRTFLQGAADFVFDQRAFQDRLLSATHDIASLWLVLFMCYVVAGTLWSRRSFPQKLRGEVCKWRLRGNGLAGIVHECLFRYLLVCPAMLLTLALSRVAVLVALALALAGALVSAMALRTARTGWNVVRLLGALLAHLALLAALGRVRPEQVIGLTASLFRWALFLPQSEAASSDLLCAAFCGLAATEVLVAIDLRKRGVRIESTAWVVCQSLVNIAVNTHVLFSFGAWYVLHLKVLESVVRYAAERLRSHWHGHFSAAHWSTTTAWDLLGLV